MTPFVSRSHGYTAGTRLTPTRFAHAEYFESDPGWDHPGGSADVVGSALRLEPEYGYPENTVLSVAPWRMTTGHLKGRVQAVSSADPAYWQNAQIIFDYRDAQNYKFAGLRVGGGRWVIGAVTEGVETILADSTNSPPQADTPYKLDVVVARVGGQDTVTLYANDAERVTWTRGSGPILTGGRVGVMMRGGAAHFQELEQWAVGRVTKTYSTGGQRIALRRDNALYFTYTDHLGSSSLLTTEQGQEVPGTRLKYYAYGAPRPGSATATHDAFARGYTPATYTGQTRDASTGLMYYGARFYDPALGIFLAPDTIVPQPGNPQALNRYSYVLGNPLRYTDPTGHWSYDVHAGLTYYTVLNQGLALAVQQGDSSFLGLSAELAVSIAWADAHVDLIAAEHMGEGSGGRYENAKKWAQTPNSELGGQTPEEYYHYPTRDEATARLTAAILGKDPAAFGQALHGFQDYFSHTLNGFTAGPGNIEALTSRCPECLKQGVPIAELIKRARQDGHSDSLWADLLGAPHRAEMLAGTEYWIRLFLLYYNGVIDQEQLNQMLSDSTDTAQAN